MTPYYKCPPNKSTPNIDAGFECSCVQLLLRIQERNDELLSPSTVSEVVGLSAREWVAEQRGYLQRQDIGKGMLGRRLRGRGSRRKNLDAIVQVKGGPGVKPVVRGDIALEVAVCKVWVEHLRRLKVRAWSELEHHVTTTLHEAHRRELAKIGERRVRVLETLRRAFEAIQPELQSRKRRGLAVLALAEVYGVGRDAVEAELYRSPLRRDAADPPDPREAILPPSEPGSPRILIDLEVLRREEGAQRQHAVTKR